MINQKNENLDISYYLVAFIDLLGQQDHLRNLKNLPNPEDVNEIAAFSKTLKQTYGAVTGMRELFQGFFDNFSNRENNTGQLTEIQKKTFEDLTNHPINFQRFSDAVIIYLPLRTDKYKLPTRGVFGVLAAAGTTFLCSLAANHPLRGGIDVGIATEITKGEIYGSALARAYTLESKIAQYPRIVLGQEIINYLTSTAKQEPKDIYADMGKRTAERCLDLIAVDDDGLPFLDYLGEGFKKHIASNLDKKVLKKAYLNVMRYSAKYQQEHNSKLAFRNTLLKNYFEARLPLWFKDANEFESTAEL